MPEQPIHIVEMLHDRSLEEQVEYLTNEVARLQKILRYLLGGHLDFENIRARGIKADNIEAQSITAEELAADSITTEKIQAGAVSADKISVDKLSAITANLGTVTAGEISSNTVINVGTDANVGRNLNLNENDAFSRNGIKFRLNGVSRAEIDVTNSDLDIRANGYVTLNGGSGAYANGGRIAVEGLSASINLMAADGTPVWVNFIGGTFRGMT